MPEYGKCDALSTTEPPVAGGASCSTKRESPQWFALAVKPRFDKAVARALEMKGYETFLPLYKKQHKEGTRSKDSELPLFPGYVCCRFEVENRLPVVTTPGVVQVLGAGNTPIALDDGEIVSLQTAIRSQLPLQPFPFVQIGQRVRIDKGVLAGVHGIVISLKQSLRLVLSITLLQRSVLLEIDREQVSAERMDWRDRIGSPAAVPCGLARGN